MKKYKWQFILATSLWTLGVILLLIPGLIYKELFDRITTLEQNIDAFFPLIILIIGVFAINILIRILFNTTEWIILHIDPKITTDLFLTSFESLHKHSYGFFTSNFVGSLVNRVSNFVYAYSTIFAYFLWDGIPLLISVLGSSFILLFIAPQISLIILIWSIIFMFIVSRLIEYKTSIDIPKAKAKSAAKGILSDTITNFINVKLFASLKRESNTFKKSLIKLEKKTIESWKVSYHMHWIQGSLIFIIEFICMGYAIWLWSNQALTTGDLVLIQTYLLSITMNFWDFSHIVKSTYQSLSDAQEMIEIINTPYEVIDKKGAKNLLISKGKIDFKQVNFAYNKTRQIFKDLNLIIQPGEKIALVGPSGAGKSSFIKLLLRYFDVSKGQILIDDQNIAQVKQDSLHQQISLVPQEPILFHRSLLENIRYGNPKATDQQVIKAAKQAFAHNFIKDLSDGYNTLVGERGIKLSGGERQRVAIARAILKNAPILLLDEATSSLDSESEKLIQKALINLMKGKTSIIIAHRLSTIMEMDRVLVMKKGNIIEQGSHEELVVKKEGLYKKLWDLQVGGFLVE